MIKNILNLEGAQELTAAEQKSIKGGTLCNVCNATDCDNVPGLPTCVKKLHLL